MALPAIQVVSRGGSDFRSTDAPSSASSGCCAHRVMIWVAFTLGGMGSCSSPEDESGNGGPTVRNSDSVSRVMTVDGVEFETVGDAVISIPRIGAETPVNLAMRITNRSAGPLRFNKFDTVFITMSSSSGQTLRMDGGRDGTSPGEAVSQPVAPGGSIMIGKPARLAKQADETLRLAGPDGFGGEWYIDGLRSGKYSLRITYESHMESTGSQVSIWKGKVITEPKEVELR